MYQLISYGTKTKILYLKINVTFSSSILKYLRKLWAKEKKYCSGLAFEMRYFLVEDSLLSLIVRLKAIRSWGSDSILSRVLEHVLKFLLNLDKFFLVFQD